MQYAIVHTKHDGCYDFRAYRDERAHARVLAVTLNPPALFLFPSRMSAQNFFREYIRTLDCIDARCMGPAPYHAPYCSCGTVELDEHHQPVLFYTKTNQIFLLLLQPQQPPPQQPPPQQPPPQQPPPQQQQPPPQQPLAYLPSDAVCRSAHILNATNDHIRHCKRLSDEQKDRFLEFTQICCTGVACVVPELELPQEPDAVREVARVMAAAPTPPQKPRKARRTKKTPTRPNPKEAKPRKRAARKPTFGKDAATTA